VHGLVIERDVSSGDEVEKDANENAFDRS